MMYNVKAGSSSRESFVSVIIPAYNSAYSLGHAIESALMQAPPRVEVIVINDGSTDATAEVAKSFGDRIIYLEQENQGQGAARNLGLEKATGEFIAFLDADDYWKPGFLKACVGFLWEHPEAVAVSTGLILRQANGLEKILPKIIQEKTDFGSCVLNNFYQFWAEHDHVRTGSNLIRHDVIRQAGFQRDDLRISQDLEYWGYIATFGKWGFISEPLWVGNSRSIAARSGWIAKYRTRRRLCPSVENWEDRIIPRLSPEDWPSLRVVRGRVAANFALSKIKAGNSRDARAIVEKYGEEMPANWSTKVMRLGFKAKTLGWLLACMIVRLREWYKSVGAYWTQRLHPDAD